MFLVAFLAATVLPFSSDVVLSAMLVGGYEPYQLVIVAAIGNWLGGMVSYYMGYLGKWEWIEKYLGVRKSKIERYQQFVDRYGSYFGLLTWLPFIGDPLAIALGFSRTRTVPTAIWMLIGKSLRYVVIAWLTLSGVDWWHELQGI